VEALQHLMSGFATALSPLNLLFATIGCILGTLIGVLPGWGRRQGRHSSFRSHSNWSQHPQLSCWRRSTTGHVRGDDHLGPGQRSGEAASVVTCLDGYEMAKRGRAGAALVSRPSAPSSAAASLRSDWSSWRFPVPLGPEVRAAGILLADPGRTLLVMALAGKSLTKAW